MKNRNVEGLADLVQGVDGRAGHATLYLADKAGGHAGPLSQIALAQAQLFAPGPDSVSQWQHALTSSLVTDQPAYCIRGNGCCQEGLNKGYGIEVCCTEMALILYFVRKNTVMLDNMVGVW
jgi:hypothetical protein